MSKEEYQYMPIDREMYGRVYDVTAAYMKKLNDHPVCSREVFLLGLGHPSNQVDMTDWADLSMDDYISACFLYLLGRIPSQKEVTYWQRNKSRDPRYEMLKVIFRSAEFKNRKIQVFHCPYAGRLRRLENREKRMTGFRDTSVYQVTASMKKTIRKLRRGRKRGRTGR